MRKAVRLPAARGSLAAVAAVFFTCLTASQTRAQDGAFLRGDANGDGARDISDAVFTLDHLFRGGPAGACDDAADANDDGRLDVSDAVRLLVHLFGGGPELLPPGGSCGADPTPDPLSCREYPACGGILDPQARSALRVPED